MQRPALDWPTDPWDASDQTGTVERLRRQTRPIKWIVYTAMVLGIVMIMIAGAVGWWYLGQINPRVPPATCRASRCSRTTISTRSPQRLLEQGLISDVGVFEWYVDRNGGLEITPGYYEIRPDDHMGNVLGRLRTPPGQTYTKVTFPEGFTVARMAERLDSTIDRLTADDFLAAAQDPTIRSTWQPEGVTSLEGLLFPDTYQVSNAESEGQVIERMIGLMERVGNQEDIVNAAAAQGRTPYEILIIASMIEREAGVAEDRAKIARVIYNRLFIDMPLAIDASVYYGATQAGLDTSLPFSDLRAVDGPWNTYLRTGLPLTPIANPGRASIQAGSEPGAEPGTRRPDLRRSAEPRQCFYYYYVLGNEDGSHVFAATSEQHDANVAAAARSWTPLSSLAVLIGSPVAHSLSPTIHRAAFEAAGVDWTYAAFDVAPGDGAAAVEAMRVLGHRWNVGDDAAQGRRRRGCRRARPGGTFAASRSTPSAGTAISSSGSSTDGAGFVAVARRGRHRRRPARVAIIGAGGAARSVIDALGRAGTKDITVLNRSEENAERAAQLVDGRVGRHRQRRDPGRHRGQRHERRHGRRPVARPVRTISPCDPALLHSAQIVVDLVYHPLRTAWLAAADELGARTVDGLGHADPPGGAPAAALARHAPRCRRHARRRRSHPRDPLTPTFPKLSPHASPGDALAQQFREEITLGPNRARRIACCECFATSPPENHTVRPSSS